MRASDDFEFGYGPKGEGPASPEQFVTVAASVDEEEEEELLSAAGGCSGMLFCCWKVERIFSTMSPITSRLG